LSEDEINAIFEALGDYQDYGDAEAELSTSILTKLVNLSLDETNGV
jgi:hypothetical protein